MSNEPDSSSNRVRKVPRYSMLWLILLAGIFLALLAGTPFLPGGPRRFSEWVCACLILFVVSFGTATALLVVWLTVRWFCSWRHLKIVALIAAGLAIAIALFYTEEDWRGQRAWKEFQHEWEAKGEHFTLSGVLPPRVPDEQNFALTDIAFTSFGQVLTREGKRIAVEKRDSRFPARMRMCAAQGRTDPERMPFKKTPGPIPLHPTPGPESAMLRSSPSAAVSTPEGEP